MKNKKIILGLVFVLFLPFVVFGANGENCKKNNGTCRAEDAFQACLSSEKNSGQSDCNGGEVCCVASGGSVVNDCIAKKCAGKTGDVLESCKEECQKQTSQPSSEECIKQKCAGKTGAVLESCKEECQKQAEKKEGGTGATTITFPNPLKFDTIEQVLTSLMSNLQAIIATIALIFIVIGGMFIISAGTSKRVEDGKKMIQYALIGLAIVLAAPTFLREIKIILGAGDTGTGLRAIDIAKNVLVFLLSLLGIFAIITMVIGGFMYLTSYGNEKQMEAGKNTAKWAVVGIAVALSGVILIKQVVELLQ